MADERSSEPARTSGRWWRPRFGTRTLFIGFTVLCLVVGWGSLHYYRNYRHEQAMRVLREVGGQFAGEQDGKVARVYLANPEIDDEKIGELLDHLHYVRGMEELDLVNLPITDEVVVHFHGFPQLKQLYLFQTDLTVPGVESIAVAMPHVEVKLEAPDPIATKLAATNIYRHAIVALATNPAGTEFVTGSGDGKLRWWGVGRLFEPVSIAAHETWLFAAAFHPDGKRLVTAGGDDLIRVWNVATREQVQELRGHTDDVHALGFSLDGRALYSAGDDRTLRQWNLDDESDQPTIIGEHDEQIPCLAVHPTTGEVVTGSRDETIAWWDPDTGERLRRISDHQGDVMSVAFSPDGKLLASASYDGAVRLRSGDDGTPIATLSGHTGRVFHVVFNSGGDWVASSGVDGVKVWDVKTRLPVFQYAEAQYVSAVRFANQDEWLLASDADGFVHVIDCRSGKLFRKIATARAYLAGAR